MKCPLGEVPPVAKIKAGVVDNPSWASCWLGDGYRTCQAPSRERCGLINVAEDRDKDTQLRFALDLLRGTKSVAAGEIKKTNWNGRMQ